MKWLLLVCAVLGSPVWGQSYPDHAVRFVIPYPPGFPILVPGQVISRDILAFMEALDVKEIHGFRPELGFRVYTRAALQESVAVRAAEENAVEQVVESAQREAVAAK